MNNNFNAFLFTLQAKTKILKEKVAVCIKIFSESSECTEEGLNNLKTFEKAIEDLGFEVNVCKRAYDSNNLQEVERAISQINFLSKAIATGIKDFRKSGIPILDYLTDDLPVH